MLQKLIRFLTNTPTGLKPQIKDSRDIEVGSLWGWLDKYEPKHNKLKLDMRAVRDQFDNTCGWNAATAMKEVDEKEDLDERSLVMFGRELGYISGNGFSTLRNNQKALQKRGVCRKGFLASGRASWSEYSNPKYLTPEMRANAVDRRIKSYLAINNHYEAYKALDEGRPVEIGIDWYTGWNMSGGFKLPWIVYRPVNYLVGGHALCVYGYDIDYKGQKVFIVRNSFGESYADKGDFYLTPEMLGRNISKYGAFINYDLDVDLIGWLKTHANQVVKGGQSPDVYLIQGEEKRKFNDLATFYSHGYSDKDIVIVADDILAKVKQGENLHFWNGKLVEDIKTIILQKNNLKDIFESYFKELF